MKRLSTPNIHWRFLFSQAFLMIFMSVIHIKSASAANIYETDASFYRTTLRADFAPPTFQTNTYTNSMMPACAGNPDEIGGFVFRDFNFDGALGTYEPGVEGVEVYLFTCDTGMSSTLVSQTTTDSDGNYTFSGLTIGQPYRVEFAIPAEQSNYMTFTPVGPNNFSNVQFTTPGTCDITVGASAQADYHQSDPLISVPCYLNGSGAAGSTSDSVSLLAVQYSATGENQNINWFTASQVGSLWGVAHERTRNTVFTGAVLRRHMGFGPGGTGAIYFINVDNVNNPSIIHTLDLDALGFDTGLDPRIAEPLPDGFNMPNHDSGAWDLVARMSLGDVEVSADGKTLYTVNLATRELISVDLTDYILTGAFPTAANITSSPIPSFNCNEESDWRPWGLKYHHNRLYLGGICSAETSQDQQDLTATVISFDGATFTEEFTMSLDFARGAPFILNPDRNEWYPWSNDLNVVATQDFTNRLIYPQPILSDIEFDIDGSMILGFMDRTGHMGGHQNYGPDQTSTGLFQTFTGGDMIRVCNIAGNFVLEGAGGCTTSIGLNFPQGPNGQEYYWEDQYPENPIGDPTAFTIHQEIITGSLALLPGSGDVVATVFDPIIEVNSGGITWFDNETGGRDRSYQVFATPAPGDGGIGPGFPGKSNGLGDIELICLIAPMEIGNYAWLDCNGDGIQDPCEAAIPNINVTLYEEGNAVPLATTTTGPNGEYYFNTANIGRNLIPNTRYDVVFGSNGQYDTTNDLLVVDGVEYMLTLANTGQTPNDDINDSDAITHPTAAIDEPFASWTTGCIGGVNHNIDAGLSAGIIMSAVEIINESCPGANDGQIIVTTTAQNNTTLEYSIDGGPFGSSNTFTGLAPGTYTVVAQPVGGASGCGSAAEVVSTITGGNALIPPTTKNYIICQDTPTPAGEGILATCEPCTDNTGATSAAIVNWYDMPTGGTLLYTGATFDPIATGDADTSTPDTYTFYAECICGDCASPRTPADFMIIENPAPEIDGANLVCPNEISIYTITSPIMTDHTFEWELISGGGTFVNGNMGTNVSVQFENSPGTGPYLLKVTETGAGSTPCVAMDTIEVIIHGIEVVCNDLIQISLDENGCALITPDQILEGVEAVADSYSISVLNQSGQNFGDKVTCANIGQSLTVTVSSLCSGNSCWSMIEVEDKFNPIIDCPTDPIMILCTEDAQDVPAPIVTDNCTSNPSIEIIDYSLDASDACDDGIKIYRTYIATDDMANESEPCLQTIMITRTDEIDFPADITWNCLQYAAYPNITDPTPLAEDVPDSAPETPNLVDVPFYLSQDKLATSGSGILHIAQGTYCNFAVTHTDDTLATCGGFKILRTWSVLDWCTGEVLTEDANGDDYQQLIKIVDNVAPGILADDFEVTANLSGGTQGQLCRSMGFIPVPSVMDNCTEATLSIFTDLGEATYVNGENGNNGGYIPSPGLTLGQHEILYRATDVCGNMSELTVTVRVIDDLLPTAICDEITDVNINNNGTATLYAEALNDGSTDNCCIDRFEAKLMDEPLTAFSEVIHFDCENDVEMVVLRVYDCFENYNECMVEVRVDDKILPTCAAPADLTITCDMAAAVDLTDFEALTDHFGSASATDNCEGVIIEELEPIVELQGCGEGLIQRRFQAIDAAGNVSVNTCKQTIFVLYSPNWQINFPGDWEGTCADISNPDSLEIIAGACDLIAATHTDILFNISDDGACYKILRRWEVINWCVYDNNNEPLELNDNYSLDTGEVVTNAEFGNVGYIVYTQTIKVLNDEPPLLSYNGETAFCLNDNCEYGMVTIPLNIEANCTIDLTTTFTIDYDRDGTMDAVGNNILYGAAPVGEHRIFYTVADGCGNHASIDIDFTVSDCKAPTPYCHSGLVVDLMNTDPPMIEVPVHLLDAGSFDNCGGEVKISFSADTLDVTRIYTCNQLGFNNVEVWITDEAGNQDFCNTQIEIQQNLLLANGTPCFATTDLMVSGMIETEAGEGLAGVQVELNGGNMTPTTTDQTGMFTFEAVEEAYDYSLTPMHDIDPLNGVTTYDLTLIKRHVLSTDFLDSPYQLIAADANNSESITTADIIALRRLILQMDEVLANNSSWRFVEQAYEFNDPTNPWEEQFAELINFNNLTADELSANFIAVKIGDINGSASANINGGVEERTFDGTFYFDVENQALNAGEQYTVDFRAKDFDEVVGWQMTLDYSDALTLENIKTSDYVQLENFGQTLREQNALTMSWHSEKALDVADETVLFSLTFTAQAAGNLSDYLQANSFYTIAEAYREVGTKLDLLEVAIAYDNALIISDFTLLQNQPNPFKNATLIPFNLPRASTVKLTIFDPSGKVVFEQENDYEAGYQSIEINKNELGAGGVFYYQLDTPTGSATRKMIRF